jgi:hypothetical protein
MSAWSDSPYRAIGVYIGGLNRGCSQPNLTASWVAEQTAAGWHLIPTYVGLQAPTSSCSSCATLSPGSASSQGAAAAEDAVEQAQLVGIGAGSPIYFDMESYVRTSSASSSTLNFLAAWTNALRAAGYDSGVYSSSASGIADLASRLGSGYAQPDDLWIANWNGRTSTSDPYVPASAWSEHQRIHQYRGGHDETYGGVTINIDNNSVDGETVGSATLVSGDNPVGYLDLAQSPAPGQVRVRGWAFDPNSPTEPLAIRLSVGGKEGTAGAATYELGPVAAGERADLLARFPRAGASHGFDVSFPVVGSGRQRLCVYALNVGPGADKLLGCRRVGVPVPMSLLAVRASGDALRLRLRCEWPAGTQCPGQILLRAQVRQRFMVRRNGRKVVRTRMVRRPVAQRAFRLVGARSHSFRVPLNGRGRLLTAGAARPWSQLVVAIPGGRVTRAVRLK